MLNNRLTLSVNIDNSDELKEKFKKKDKKYRIEAVIHDGQYYTIDKWAKTSLVNKKDIVEYINSNKEKFIMCNDSYRVSVEEIEKWYSNNDIEIEECIVPSNFTPKIWGGYTEAEYLELKPRRLISSLSLNLSTCSDINKKKIQYIASMFGDIVKESESIITIHSLDILYIKDKICKEFGKDFFESIYDSSRNLFYRRDISELDNLFLGSFVKFYSFYILGIIKNYMSTISIYIDNEEDLNSQIVEWVFLALSKYNEQSGVPFSGYFTSVMNHWPYDLPYEELGKELAEFQKKKNNTIKKLEIENDTNEISYNEIKAAMSKQYTSEDFDRLYKEEEEYNNVKYARDLYYESTGDSKKLDSAYYIDEKVNPTNKRLACILTMSMIDAFLKVNDIESFETALKSLMNCSFEIDPDLYVKLNEDYKAELLQKIIKYNKVLRDCE